MENLTNEEAAAIAGSDPDFHRRDLFEAIERGNLPSWTLDMQIMPYEEAKSYRLNPFDLTKTWPHADYPLHEVGRLTLDRNPTNHFAEIEQAAFSPSNTVPGTGLSPDKMLLARLFSYPAAQRNRIGTNYNQLPVNAPTNTTNSYDKEGAMQYHHTGNAPVYAPTRMVERTKTSRAYLQTAGKPTEKWFALLTRFAATMTTILRRESWYGRSSMKSKEIDWSRR